MKKMKKVGSVIAAITMAASLLAGCGGSGGSGTTTAAETKAADTKAAPTDAKAAEADTTAAPAAAENPVAGKKVAYLMLLPSATIFQMWKDSCASLCDALDAVSYTHLARGIAQIVNNNYNTDSIGLGAEGFRNFF